MMDKALFWIISVLIACILGAQLGKWEQSTRIQAIHEANIAKCRTYFQLHEDLLTDSILEELGLDKEHEE